MNSSILIVLQRMIFTLNIVIIRCSGSCIILTPDFLTLIVWR